MEMSKEIKKKKEFKDTKLAYNIREFIYSYRRWKRYNRAEIKFWKKLNFWIIVILLNISVGFMFAQAIFRWFFLGEY
jgi:hypothetical protein